MKAKSDDEAAVHEKELKELRAKVGQLVLELDARKKWEALNGRDEAALLTLQSEMQAEGSPASIASLCRWVGVARSMFYYKPEKAPSRR